MGTISQMAKAIVPYIKGYVKSGHDETTSNITTPSVFRNTLDLEVEVLTPLEFTGDVALVGVDAQLTKDHRAHRFGHVVWHAEVIADV